MVYLRAHLPASAILLGTLWFAPVFAHAGAPAESPASSKPEPLHVEITLRDGKRLSTSFDGVGCSQTLCSRVSLRARSDESGTVSRIPFDSIEHLVSLVGGEAQIDLRDGTSRRIAIVKDNQVLYLLDSKGATRRVDVADIARMDFLARVPVAHPSSNPQVPRVPWGDPDLQGLWSGRELIGVPRDRVPELGVRTVLTEEEFQARKTTLVKSASNGNIEATNFGADPELLDYSSRQASLVVDPPDGRVPERSPAAKDRRPGRNSFVPGFFDSVLELGALDRCIAMSALPASAPANDLQIVQSPGYVAIRTAWIHETRVIPLDRRPYLGESLRSYAGDSRGRWEGATLVVETRNMNGATALSGAEGRLTEQLTITERFALVDLNTLSYEATLTDPGTWPRPWTMAFPRKRESRDVMYEYACHEGNYSVRNILSASRAAERDASR